MAKKLPITLRLTAPCRKKLEELAKQKATTMTAVVEELLIREHENLKREQSPNPAP